MSKVRFKRTTPFSKQCGFIIHQAWGELERCESDAVFGLYFGSSTRVSMISLCLYHTIYQESIWISEQGDDDE